MNNKVHLIILIVALVKNLINVIAILFVCNDYTIMRIIMQEALPEHQEIWVFPRFSVLLLQRKMLNTISSVSTLSYKSYILFHTYLYYQSSLFQCNNFYFLQFARMLFQINCKKYIQLNIHHILCTNINITFSVDPRKLVVYQQEDMILLPH